MMETRLRSWITDGTGKPFYARKEFTLKSVPKKASAYVCGLGQFQFYVNGKKVGDHVLDPAWTDYNKLVYYVRFDIADYLREGENVLAAEVGNGWYLGDFEEGYSFHFPPFMPPNPNPYLPFDRELVLGVHVELEDAERNIVTLDTDESWETAPHPVIHSNCFGSETVDGRRKLAGWNDVLHIKGREWSAARTAQNSDRLSSLAEKQMIPPVKIIHTYPGKFRGVVNGRAIYDFGQNVSGMLEFEVIGKTGEAVHAWPAEKLAADGDVNQMAKNWLPIDVKETYILAQDDVWEKFQMTFTYFGGRYIAVDCAPEKIRNIKLYAISSAGERAGEFYCDDERLMKIYDLVEKAVEANMVGVHTDCPTIERFAWQEENHLMAPSIMYMKKVKKHWEKFLRDTGLAQHTGEDWFNDMEQGKYYPGDGLIPAQAPCYMPNVLPVPGLGDFYNTIGWGSSIILGTYWHYQFYGDTRIIEEHYEEGKKYLDFLKTCVNEDGFINHGLGDWGNPLGEYARENVETVFLYADTKVMCYFAQILGKTEDDGEFSVYAEQVRQNYNEKLLTLNPETGKYCYHVWGSGKFQMTQAAEALPLYWGLVPEDKKQDVVESLRRTMETAGAFQAGEISLPYIIQTMAEHGMNDLICDFILRKEHPSYYAFVADGETTLGEYWEQNPRSHCHDMMGHIIEWYYNGMAGIRLLKPGFKKVRISPYLPETVNELICSYQSASGLIEVHVQRIGSETEVIVKTEGEITVEIGRSDMKYRFIM